MGSNIQGAFDREPSTLIFVVHYDITNVLEEFNSLLAFPPIPALQV